MRRATMKVMKFGGGCFKDARSISQAAAIIGREKERPVVVVSAVTGVTDMLIEACSQAERNERGVTADVQRIQAVHDSLIRTMIKNADVRRDLSRYVETALKKVGKLLYGISYTAEVTPATRSHVLSFGERLAAFLLAALLIDRRTPARPVESDKIGMLTDDVVENATVDLPGFRRALKRLKPGLGRHDAVDVVTGFFGINPRGKVATFGRNGTDYSAAAVAAGLGASRLEIWKDVEGFMSADPKLEPQARKIDRLSYYEAAELSYFGARILHPRTLEPLHGLPITVEIKNLWHPDNPGTEVLPNGSVKNDVIKSVAFNPDIVLLRIHGPGVGYKPGIIGTIGHRLSALGINIYSIITSQTCINLLVDRKDAFRSHEALKTERGGVIERVDLEDGIVLVAAVGEGLLRQKGLAARIFSSVSKAGVNVEMISTGASEVASYFIVKRPDLEKTVHALHQEFFQERRRP
jgi:aspartate kinase